MTEVICTPTIREQLRAPIPKEAIKQHPTKKYLSTVNVAYIIERLNDVFGESGWSADYQIMEASGSMIVVRCDFSAASKSLAGNIKRTAFGGNDNPDRGDAYKGACTDALSKAASQIGIAQDVYKGLHDKEPAGPQATVKNGQVTVQRPKSPTPAAPAKPLVASKPIQKVDSPQTSFPHGHNVAPPPAPEKGLPAQPQATPSPNLAGVQVSDSDMPDNLRPATPEEYKVISQRVRVLKIDPMTKVGTWLKKKYKVEATADLSKSQWDEAVELLETAGKENKLQELLG